MDKLKFWRSNLNRKYVLKVYTYFLKKGGNKMPWDTLYISKVTFFQLQVQHVFAVYQQFFLSLEFIVTVKVLKFRTIVNCPKGLDKQDKPKYSQISVIRTSIIRNYWVIRRRQTVPIFFSIIYCNKPTNYSNFDYPKNSIFRSDSSVPIKEIAIKLPFEIRSPNVTKGDHDFFVW